MMRVLQISDTHIARDHQQFGRNIALIADWVKAQKPDLVISTGDVSMNGALGDTDLGEAARYHRDLGADVLAVPGNHDVGDMPDLRADQVLDDARLARFETLIGPDRWTHDIPGWRLIGLNAMLCSTGHRREAEQEEWLADALDCPQKIAVFMHKPLFIDTPDEGERGYWTIKPAARQRLLHLFGKADVRLISSGHLHIYRERTIGKTTHLWCPSAAFVCGETQEDLGGERSIGLIAHDFSESGHKARFVAVDGTENLLIEPHLPVLYPPMPIEAAAR